MCIVATLGTRGLVFCLFSLVSGWMAGAGPSDVASQGSSVGMPTVTGTIVLAALLVSFPDHIKVLSSTNCQLIAYCFQEYLGT